MNNAQVAHAWAAQSRESGKGSNFYFDGPTIYSYGAHFPIATFTDRTTASGLRIVLFTTRGYSNTTARHCAMARNALHGLNVRVIECRYPENAGNPDNVADMVERYSALLLKVSRARSNGEWYLREADSIRHMLADYCTVYGIAQPELPAMDAATLATVRERANKEAAKRKAEAAKRKAEAKERERLRALDYAEKIAEWRNGADANALALWQYSGESTALRLSRDGKHVETSRGASVTIRTARALYRAIVGVKGASDETRAAMVESFPDVDGFRLRAIGADGSAVIGCHTLEWPEIERFAISQGWAK